MAGVSVLYFLSFFGMLFFKVGCMHAAELFSLGFWVGLFGFVLYMMTEIPSFMLR